LAVFLLSRSTLLSLNIIAIVHPSFHLARSFHPEGNTANDQSLSAQITAAITFGKAASRHTMHQSTDLTRH